MNKPSSNPNIELLTLHAMQTLPDSIAARKQLLLVIGQALPKGHDRRFQAALLLRQLVQHEASQLEFSLNN